MFRKIFVMSITMDGASTWVLPTNEHVANVILKNGRNEVQIYPIVDGFPQVSAAKKHELEVEDEIEAAVWVQVPAKKSSKRKAAEETDGQVTGVSYHLVVLLGNGDLLVFSPELDHQSSRISEIVKLEAICASRTTYSVFGIHKGTIVEVSLAESKVVKTHKFKTDKHIHTLNSIDHKTNGSTSKSQHLVLGSENVYVVDVSRKKNLVLEFPQAEGAVSSMVQSGKNVFAVRGSTVFQYQLNEPKTVGTFSASEAIDRLVVQTVHGQEFVYAFTANGVEVFGVDPDALHEEQPPACVITTSSDELNLSDVFYTDKLVGVWHDSLQPQFVEVAWSTGTVGEVSVIVDEKEQESVDTEELTFVEEVPEINNLPFDQLYEELTAVLLEDSDAALQLCISNDNEFNIKETIQKLAASTSPYISILFKIIGNRVAGDPSKHDSLSIWLKWLLLIHGGTLATQYNQHETLVKLRSELTKGMDLVPKLLSLQGRLQLLKSQAELRKSMEEEKDDEVEHTYNETTLAEETIEYANGENDDYEG